MITSKCIMILPNLLYKDCSNYDYCGKILIILLEKNWIHEFEFFLNITSLSSLAGFTISFIKISIVWSFTKGYY